MADIPNDEGLVLSQTIEELRAGILVLEEMIAQSRAALAQMEVVIEANLKDQDHPEKP